MLSGIPEFDPTSGWCIISVIIVVATVLMLLVAWYYRPREVYFPGKVAEDIKQTPNQQMKEIERRSEHQYILDRNNGKVIVQGLVDFVKDTGYLDLVAGDSIRNIIAEPPPSTQERTEP